MANEWDHMLEQPDKWKNHHLNQPSIFLDQQSSNNRDTDNDDETLQTYMQRNNLPNPVELRKNSTRRLSRLQVQQAMTDIKRFAESRLEHDLHLTKHCTPLAFMSGTGVNDELDGSESKSAVKFVVPNEDIPRGLVTKGRHQQEDSSNHDDGQQTQKTTTTRPDYSMECEIVQSLAKWKRIMLQRLDVPVGHGIYCDSTSIRKGYKGDTTHSVVADQWDFEIRMTAEQRSVDKLKSWVTTIYKIITDAEDMIVPKYPQIVPFDDEWRLPKTIHFLTSDELHEEFPNLDVHDRETAACRKYGAIFIIGMGWPLRDGSQAEEIRSPSYDDWNLNGDIIVLHPRTKYRHELSSMGIRVDARSLREQLEHRSMLHETTLDFQCAVLNDELPLSYGGGIGISRLMMLLLRTCHIGEVQCGVWHTEHYKQASAAGIDMIPDRILNIESSEKEERISLSP